MPHARRCRVHAIPTQPAPRARRRGGAARQPPAPRTCPPARHGPRPPSPPPTASSCTPTSCGPSNLPASAKTPVILSIGPYFNHAGQTGPAGPVEGTSYDPVGPSSGPSDRFLDFVEGAKLMEKGYSFVMVDLRGFGGSTGCLDWGGPGEQSDVVSAVEWAAQQSWSTGKVGMYGKSYDGVTGLIGVNKAPARARGGRLAGAGLRPLSLPLRRRHAARQRVPHPRAVRPDRLHPGPDPRRARATTPTGSTTPSAPAAWPPTTPTRPPTTTTTRRTGRRAR